MCVCLSMWGCVCLCLMCVLYLSVCRCGGMLSCVRVCSGNKLEEFVFEVVACGCPSLPLHNGTEPQLHFLLHCSPECNMLNAWYIMWTTIWFKVLPFTILKMRRECSLGYLQKELNSHIFGLAGSDWKIINSMDMLCHLLYRGQSLFMQKIAFFEVTIFLQIRAPPPMSSLR